MSDDTKANIDPRFDPAFQRGFDPATPIRERVPDPTPRPTAPVEAPPASIPEPARLVAPTAARTPLPAAELGDGEPVIMTVQDADEPDREPAPESSQARNPFLIVLAIVAVVLVAVGVWLFVQSGNEFNSREVRSQGDYMSLDATIHMAPFVALLGAATAIGVLFLFAAKWRKR